VPLVPEAAVYAEPNRRYENYAAVERSPSRPTFRRAANAGGPYTKPAADHNTRGRFPAHARLSAEELRRPTL